MVSSKESSSFLGGHTELAGINSNDGLKEDKVIQDSVQVTKIIEKDSSGANIGEYTSLITVSDFGNTTGTTLTGNAGKVKLYGYTGALNVNPITITSPTLTPVSTNSQILLCLAQSGSNNSKVGTVYITPQLTIDRVIGIKDGLCP